MNDVSNLKYTHPKLWISFVGYTPFAVVNTVYYAIEKDCYVPDIFYFYYTKQTQVNINFIKEVIGDILEFLPSSLVPKEQRIKTIEIEEQMDIRRYAILLSEVITKYKQLHYEIAIDITPGLKIMAIASMHVAVKYGIDRIYYTFLKDRIYEDMFALEIPEYVVSLNIIDKKGTLKHPQKVCNLFKLS